MTGWLVLAVVVTLIAVLIAYEDVIFNKVVDAVLAKAQRRPYFHLYHSDGTPYMERWWIVPFANDKEGCFVATWRKHPVIWLLQKLGVSIRLHHIHTPDLDRALHDHPWTFVSAVLRGWYVEERPVTPEKAEFNKYAVPLDITRREPLSLRDAVLLIDPPLVEVECEATTRSRREVGTWALRRFHHRHRISAVSSGGALTLFISFRKRQSWGFYTPQGKTWWWIFESVHNNKPISRG